MLNRNNMIGSVSPIADRIEVFSNIFYQTDSCDTALPTVSDRRQYNLLLYYITLHCVYIPL